MAVKITRRDIDTLLAEAQNAAPQECCGLIFGQIHGDDVLVKRVQPCRNVAAMPETHFEIDPQKLIQAEREMRNGGENKGGEKILGYYHSHPNGRSAPSPYDAKASAKDGRYWIIIANGNITLWRNIANGKTEGAFDQADLMITP